MISNSKTQVSEKFLSNFFSINITFILKQALFEEKKFMQIFFVRNVVQAEFFIQKKKID